MIEALLKGKGGGASKYVTSLDLGLGQAFPLHPPNLIVGSKFPVFALFYFVFESNFPSTSPWGGGGGVYLEA